MGQGAVLTNSNCTNTIQDELVKELKDRISPEGYVVRNSLRWNSKLYKKIAKGVAMYYNSHLYEMNLYHIELEDLIQNVAFTLYRWKNFDPEAYQKNISQYIIPIVNQKTIKEKRNYFRNRKSTTISIDEPINNCKTDNDASIQEVIADSTYRFQAFVEECLARIPEDHKFFIDDISFKTKDVFRLLFNNYSGEEIAMSAGVDGKKFRKMKRILTKEFYSDDMIDLYAQLPSNVDFRPDYHLKYTKEDAIKAEEKELQRRARLSGEVKLSRL